MKNSFSALKQNSATRKFGGTNIGVADPYVSGYHYIWFDQLPPTLGTFSSQGNSQIAQGDIAHILSAACTGVTPPDGTLNKVEFTGLGGIKWAVPGNIDYGNSVSLKFVEFSKTPILDIMHGWIKLMRDYRSGITELEDGGDGDGYSKKTYAGVLYYFTTAPDAKTVEYYAAYDGVFPTKDPQDLFSSDVETVGKLDIEIEFNVDYIWHEPWVKDRCDSLAVAFQADAQSIHTYTTSSS